MTVRVEHGDCRDVMKTMADASIDAVVTDPPYALASTTKRWANSARTESTMPKAPPYARATAGFMGKQWDNGATAFDPAFWAEVLRVLKPGGHVVAFGGTRTYHRLVCATEDAGFEIRDQIGWCFGSGFPKSHNAGNGWGTALKPAWEPICLARKPLIGTVAANVLAHGTGALNIDGCRVEGAVQAGAGSTGFGQRDDGYEPGTGRQYQSNGRWPANLIHDGSEEVLAAFPETQSGNLSPMHNVKESTGWSGGSQADRVHQEFFGSQGSAARFFYSAKADKGDRLGSKHPTVKPVDLMAYLCRLVTPPGGTVLDPFAGSGATGMACMREGFDCILIEREAEYIADIKRRLDHVEGADLPLFTPARSPSRPGASPPSRAAPATDLLGELEIWPRRCGPGS